MTSPLTVIKLGGALLTDKQTPNTLRSDLLGVLATEIAACRAEGALERFILVHGVGGFGHPPVVAHKLHRGFQSAGQLIHLTLAQNRVLRLRLALAEACHAAGIPVATILPSSCMTASHFKHRETFFDAIDGFLGLGMTPLLGGDVLVDDEAGFSVYGGDALAVQLARHFSATRLVFATAVDGVHTRDPLTNPAAQRIPQLSLSHNSAEVSRHAAVDASGAMAGKLEAIRQLSTEIENGLAVDIIGMTRPGNLRALLAGRRVGTRLIA